MEKIYRSGRVGFRALGGVDLAIGDEPTGNLDAGSVREMFELLSGLHDSGATAVYVTHGLALAAVASRVITVRDGLIVGDTMPAAGARHPS